MALGAGRVDQAARTGARCSTWAGRLAAAAVDLESWTMRAVGRCSQRNLIAASTVASMATSSFLLLSLLWCGAEKSNAM